jgi:hypothetical protein
MMILFLIEHQLYYVRNSHTISSEPGLSGILYELVRPWRSSQKEGSNREENSINMIT